MSACRWQGPSVFVGQWHETWHLNKNMFFSLRTSQLIFIHTVISRTKKCSFYTFWAVTDNSLPNLMLLWVVSYHSNMQVEKCIDLKENNAQHILRILFSPLMAELLKLFHSNSSKTCSNIADFKKDWAPCWQKPKLVKELKNKSRFGIYSETDNSHIIRQYMLDVKWYDLYHSDLWISLLFGGKLSLNTDNLWLRNSNWKRHWSTGTVITH